jgi:hypothetical protein
MTRRVRLERLLGTKVYDSTGRKAGRIEEVVARVAAEGCLVESYLLGRQGLLARLSVPGLAGALIGLAGAYGGPTDRTVPWHLMDLTDPRRPRLRCTLEDLKALQPQREPT